MKLPYRFQLFGKEWRVRWGDPSGDLLDAKSEWGACIYSEKLITLNPQLRQVGGEAACQVFAHELLHALDDSMAKKKGWRPLSHALIERLEIPLGNFLFENNVAVEIGGPAKARPKKASAIPKKK